MFKKLSELQEGDRAIIRSFEKEEILLKLMEMGCMPGETISIEKLAPMKDPISIFISGYLLSLRIDEAESIIVEPII
jgi:ferrous iron transport protein A